MFRLKIFIVIFSFILKQSEAKPIQSITVMVSPSRPFAFYENESLKGLEVDIIENFAKSRNAKIKYVATSAPLKEVFSSEELFSNFSQSIAFPLVFISIFEVTFQILNAQ